VAGYVLRRALWAPVQLLLVTLFVFALMRGIGGSPFHLESGSLPIPLQNELTDFYRLDDSWLVQFVLYLKHIVALDFGPSLVVRETGVGELIGQPLRWTGRLFLVAGIFVVPIALALGLLAGARRAEPVGRAAAALAGLLVGTPVFFLTEILWHVDALRLRPVADDWGDLLLPGLLIALAPAGYLGRLVAASTAEQLGSEYVQAALGRGLRADYVLLRHVLRNSVHGALGGVLPMLGLMVMSAFFVEPALRVPGAGVIFVQAAKTRDYPTVMALTVALAALIALVALMVDVARGVLDPRLRETGV
jgi:dipeptide transport system permease protein